MRTSRIMAILVLLCFTFAGTSRLLAVEPKLVISQDKNEITVMDEVSKTVKFKIKKGVVGELSILTPGESAQILDSVSEGCTIGSHFNPTCSWRFTGGHWVRTCVY